MAACGIKVAFFYNESMWKQSVKEIYAGKIPFKNYKYIFPTKIGSSVGPIVLNRKRKNAQVYYRCSQFYVP